MKDIVNKTYTGRIKTFNGRFGFITSELGETFFHKTGLEDNFFPQKNDEVEFQIKPSKQKVNMFDACNIVLRKKGEKEARVTTEENYLIGTVKWFDSKKGYGFISEDNTEYFIHVSNLLSTTPISEDDVVIFSKKSYNGKLSAINCQLFIDGLNNYSAERQPELLQKYLSELSSINQSNYNQIKSIAQSTKITGTAKEAFLKSAFEKAGTVYQSEMLADGLVSLSAEEQNDLLQKLLFQLDSINIFDYDRIKLIAQSGKIEETAKNYFLKCVFKKATAEYKHKILFDDNLIHIAKETSEKQIELLRELGRLNIEKIKSIAQSTNIDEIVKDAFLKSAFEKADVEFQYKMFLDGLINLSEKNQTELLQKYLSILDSLSNSIDIIPNLFGSNYCSTYNRIKSIAQSTKFGEIAKDAFIKSAFGKAPADYKYKILFEDNLIDIQKETSESQIELLQKYLLESGSISYSNYDQIKSIAQSDKIDGKVKDAFLKFAFNKVDAIYKYIILFEDILIDIQKESFESQIELLQKILFELGSINYSSYDLIISIAQSDKIEDAAKNAFIKPAFENADAEYKYKILFEDNLINIQKETSESKIELLRKLGRLDIDKIKSIAQTDKLEETVKNMFLKSAFEKADAECKYNMLFDGLIILSKDQQIEFLQKYLLVPGSISYSNYDRIKSIAQSGKFEEVVKDIILKTAFEKADAEYKYKMLFEDNLIDIQKETSESQIELLRKLGGLDIERIKSIAQSGKIDETVKDTFLKFAFENASAAYQYKLLFVNRLVQELLNNLDILLITTQSGRMKFSKGQYGGKTYFEVLENDIEYLHKNRNKQNSSIEEFYDVVYGYWSSDEDKKSKYSLSSTYKQWKEAWISILEDIKRDIENQVIFANDSSEEVCNKIAQINDARGLYKIFEINFNEDIFENAIKNAIDQLEFDFFTYIKNYKWLSCVKQYNLELYNSLFEQNYHQISKIDRLHLWLQNLNPYYNYLELVQSAWQLSNDERKLLNRRIKEHAKDERLQRFIDQIPLAELIDETETTKTYRCKWRNLYYKNGSIQVFFDKTTSSEDYLWESAREEWNLLTHEYFNNRRIDDIITTVDSNNQITNITGLEDIEVKIVIAEVRKNGTTDRKTIISSNQVSRIIHNISARNQCINFLASQNSDYKVLDIQELVTDDLGSIRRDVSFMFPIPNGKSDVYLIWESAEFERSKATHIFKCSEEEVEEMERKIKDFIESNFRTRSRLNSLENDDIKVKRELQYFCRVNHDTVEYQVWENRMREVLPFLK